MAMLLLNGTVQNLFTRLESTDKDGQIRPATNHVQMLCENATESGEKRLEMVTLKVPNLEPFKALLGLPACVPVGYFVRGSELVLYSLKTEPLPIAVRSSARAA